jgi:hypothetical protein
MSSLYRINTVVLQLIFIFFCIPLAFPSYELTFIYTQITLLIPVFLLLSSFTTNIYGLGIIQVYFTLIILIYVGMPGSVIGWMSMLCAGYFVGAKALKDNIKFLISIKLFVLLTVFLSLWACFKDYTTAFSFSMLSDYFQVSSINTIPILIACTANLYCAIFFYTTFFINKKNSISFTAEYILLLFLCAAAMLTVVAFDLRIGLGVFILSILVLFCSVRSRYMIVKYAIIIFCGGLVIPLIWQEIYLAIVGFIVPGRYELGLVAEEFSEGALRYDRIIHFWEIAGLSKTNFSTWSDHFSVSGMSDFVASLFPLSLLFFIPGLSLLKFIISSNPYHPVPKMIIITSVLSSLLISVFQPDFYSMFTFFSIISLVYHGERRKRIKL